MAKQKQVSIESVYNNFCLLELSDQVDALKLMQGHLEDQKTFKLNEITIAQNAIQKLNEVVKTT